MGPADYDAAKIRDACRLDLIRKSAKENPNAISSRSPRRRWGLEETVTLTEKTWGSSNQK